MNKLVLALILTLAITSSALYDRFSGVKLLTAKDFSDAKKGIWLV